MKNKIISQLGFYWGVIGVVYILVKTIIQIFSYIIELTQSQLEFHHWIFLCLFTAFMAYTEGYKGFQKKFSPRIISRAIYLKNNLTIIRFIFAPLFCMGYFYGTKKRLITSYAVTAFVALLVLIMKIMPQPWRGMIDVGVVVGLSWGVIAIACFLFIYLKQKEFNYSPETPDQP
jgi:hypothetical protein